MSAPYTHITLVTGANQGIGFEIAKKLSTEHKDYHVILAGRRKEAIDEAVAKLMALGLAVEGLLLNQDSDESITTAAKAVEEKHGRLDVLINNAALGFPPKGVEGRAGWQAVFNTNVFGVAQVTDTFIPLLEKSQAPTKRIVMLSSTMGSEAYKADPKNWHHSLDVPPYATSKAALNMLTLHYIARLEKDPSWKISLTCPGYCATNLNNYQGTDDPSFGAINAVRLATLGIDGENGTYSNKEGPIPW
ncbi:short-chain dehydrogenase [Lasiosphaeris hirsuta]|uniref:Short-chain dehydrogenase n=1 Tax=Lasiosphaeris hirsuta TaxID=260670 RepID=A0AA40EDW5_9PEZI|nr:short-chain dehydrogenase [Lasiosphaeris hirsuta]